MSIALIATTYNQPEDLALYTQSLLKQRLVSREEISLFFADDGSDEQTKSVIDTFSAQWTHGPTHHIWHEDSGYRKALILNKAISALPKEIRWVIFTDSALLLGPSFLQDHIDMAQEHKLFMGRRVDLNAWMSDWIRRHPTLIWNKGSLSSDFYQNLLLSHFQSPSSENVNRSFRVQNSIIRKLFAYNKVPDILGSNFSICRKLLDSIQGFDEELEHYWGEDGDLFIRALEKNPTLEGRKCWAPQFHLWHTRKPYPEEAEQSYQHRLKVAWKNYQSP